jgi:hypothetical protein
MRVRLFVRAGKALQFVAVSHATFVRSAVVAAVIGWVSIGGVKGAAEPMPIRPADGERVSVNPPVFTWPYSARAYAVEIERPGGAVMHVERSRNWLMLDAPLSPGLHRWRYGGVTGVPGPWRTFFVERGVPILVVGDTDGLLRTVRARARPRSLVSTVAQDAAWDELKQLARQSVEGWSRLPLPSEIELPKGETSAFDQTQLFNANRSLVVQEEGRILASAWLWVNYRDIRALAEAKRRALNVAAWSLDGLTSFERHDQAGRSVAWALALAYDMLGDALSRSEKAQLLRAITPRLRGILGSSRYGLEYSHRLDRNPFDSHGVTALARTAVICTLLAGEDRLFDDCFRETVPRYLLWPVVWGFDQGGFANGTAYAHWGILDTHLVVSSFLSAALGVPLHRYPWTQAYKNFIVYFLPPGSPSGVFGDEAERRHAGIWATQAKAYAAAVPGALAEWYAAQHSGEDRLHPAQLFAPLPPLRTAIGAPLPPESPHAIHLEDIGWVAMHSDLADPRRTSVYFKSSFFGSYNHSHADQNSFVIHSRGRVLAVDSGYYDYYGSPHWQDWYKQTRAHNAITFDGGQGQLHDSMQAKGRVVRFEHHSAYDIATGDATAAYGGAFSKAVRSLVYVRPNILLVFDTLEAPVPRSVEWNLHSASRMNFSGVQAFGIDLHSERMCGRLLLAPDGAFSQTDKFTPPPQGDYPSQWHARFVPRTRYSQVRYLAVFDVGCTGAPVGYRRLEGRDVVDVAGMSFAFSESGEVTKAP